jgi:hypothetical protein
MPFGKKQDIAGSVINFDSVYNNFIGPSIKQSGLEPIRADEEANGGIIHKPMFERLILCEFAVADLTIANEMSELIINVVSASDSPNDNNIGSPYTKASKIPRTSCVASRNAIF